MRIFCAPSCPIGPTSQETSTKYFPRPLRRRYADAIEQHRLRREIMSTWIANSVVNRGLEVFVSELEDETGAHARRGPAGLCRRARLVRPAPGVGRDRESADQRPGRAADPPAGRRPRRRSCAARAGSSPRAGGRSGFAMPSPGSGRASRRSWTSLDEVIGPRHAAEIDAAAGEYESAGVDAGPCARRLPGCRSC